MNLWVGKLEQAISAYKEMGEASKQNGDGQSAIIALSEMAIVQIIAGRLRQATESIQDICNYVEKITLKDGRRPLALGVSYRHLSNIQREQNNLSKENFYSQEGLKICEKWKKKRLSSLDC